MIALASITAIAAICYGFILRPPQNWAEGTTGNLIGEVHIENKKDAHNLGKDAVAEAFSIWAEPSSNWEVMHNTSNLLVEARRITEGPLKTSGILLTRTEGTVEGADPDDVYNFFTSREGLLVLDPTMDPAEVEKYIERYDWKGSGKGAHLDVHESFMRDVPPGMEERYYIVLNGYHTQKRLFFCKSIVHNSRPGSSRYYENAMPTDDPRVRALNSFYFHITPTEDKKGSVVQMVNYADTMMGSTLLNWITCKAFFPGVYDRLEEKFGLKKEVTAK